MGPGERCGGEVVVDRGADFPNIPGVPGTWCSHYGYALFEAADLSVQNIARQIRTVGLKNKDTYEGELLTLTLSVQFSMCTTTPNDIKITTQNLERHLFDFEHGTLLICQVTQKRYQKGN